MTAPKKKGISRELAKLVKDLDEKYRPDGVFKPVIGLASEMDPVSFVPAASPALGYVLGTGGWPRGKLIEFLGQEGAGKTTLLVMALRDCIEDDKAHRPVAIIDVEHRFNYEWAGHLGLDLDRVVPVQPDNAEDGTDMMAELIRSNQVCAVGWDSIGGSPGRKSAETFKERPEIIAEVAKVMGRNMRVMAPMANLRDVTCFYTNQLRADMEGFHRPMTPGGHAVKHAMSIRLYIRPGKDKWHEKVPGQKHPNVVGFSMVFKTLKNSYGPHPREQYSEFFFERSPTWYDGIGFNVEADIQRLGLLTRLVEQQSGGYYRFGDVRAQGRDKFFAALREAGALGALRTAIDAKMRDPSAPSSFEAVEGETPEPLGPEIDDPEV